MDLIYDAINKVIELLASMGNVALNALPGSPFQAYISMPVTAQYMRWLNWLIPVGQIIAIAQAWLFAVAGWYVLQVVLRWTKAIS